MQNQQEETIAMAQNARNLNQDLIQWRRGLHQIPEVGIQLPQTRAYLCRILDGWDMEYKLHRSTSGIEVLIQGESTGKTVALRADMDALPLNELTGLPYAAKNGCMHACGHDAHAAMLLGAIKLLLANRRQLAGTVKCIFQPGEEGHHGARSMLEEGVLERPYVDGILGIHVTNTIPELGPGAVGLKKGPLMAGSDTFRIDIQGKGGHISDTGFAVNPIPVAAQLALRIQALREEYLTLPQKTVVAVGAIHSGETGNAIPDQARVEGSVRTCSQSARQSVLDELRRMVRNLEEKSGCSLTLLTEDTNHVVYNHEVMTENVMGTARRLFPGQGYTEIVTDIMASEDIFQFFDARKGVYIHLGCGFDDNREIFPLHNARFCLNEQVLWKGSAILAQSAADWLRKQS